MITVRTITYIVGLVLVIGLVSGAIALLVTQNRSGTPGVEILLSTVTPTPQLKVYISGAVAQPGVYDLKAGDRLVDALAAAGGANKDAQLSCINLALRVTDESHVHVPGADEPCRSPAEEASPGPEDNRLDINTASAAQLETLPGLCQVKARAIIDYRESTGPFQAVEELMNVNGIGLATYENIRDLVYVNGNSP